MAERVVHSADWHAGFDAQRAGRPCASCPHPSKSPYGFNQSRKDWIDGWHDGKHSARWPDWFEVTT